MQTEEDKQMEAIYYSVLADVEALPIRQQVRLALSWVKFVLANKCSVGDEVRLTDLMNACEEFAANVCALPFMYAKSFTPNPAHEPCGKCMACIANGTSPPPKGVLQ